VLFAEVLLELESNRMMHALAELNGEDDDEHACPFAVCLLKGSGYLVRSCSIV
jgi:hypothetical protein